jgi:putative peptidoglycan lipid II flippase
MDLFRGGKFHRADAAATTQLFVILAITLAIWAVQGIYARAFYAASDTKTPAITGTLITVLSAPCTGRSSTRLACAASPSHPTSASSSRPRRSPSCSIASAWSPSRTSNTPNSPAPCSPPLIAYAATAVAAHFLPPVSTHPRDLLTIAAASLAWAAAAALTLLATGSKLPRQNRR